MPSNIYFVDQSSTILKMLVRRVTAGILRRRSMDARIRIFNSGNKEISSTLTAINPPASTTVYEDLQTKLLTITSKVTEGLSPDHFDNSKTKLFIRDHKSKKSYHIFPLFAQSIYYT